MQPTEILKSEHRVIERVLDCLEKMANGCRERWDLDTTAARQALDFLTTFADGCHHHKEERHLFPRMEQRGIPREYGPIGVMLHEHDKGRHYMQKMAQALAAVEGGNRWALQQFATAALDYVLLLRDHILKEDLRLFPMADQVLAAEEQDELVRAFNDAEAHDIGTGKHERYLKLADDLCARLGVAKPAERPAGCGCGHKAQPCGV
jgi:hemerythrin-like domain-containing protein